jgi:hypothetical protein
MFTVKRLLTAGGVLALAASLAACSGGKNTSPSIIPQHEPTASRPQQDFPDEGIVTTTTPKIAVAHYQIGQTANLAIIDTPVGQVGAVAPRFAISTHSPTARKLQVNRVATSMGGGEIDDHPEKGLFLGFYLKYKMVTDPNPAVTWTDYVVVNGHHYDESSSYVAAFPMLEGNETQHAGETIEGWVTFDVPARHGTFVLVDQMSNEKIATWSF